MFIDPGESRQFPDRSAQLRLSVLLRTYQGDYHTDSFELDRLVKQIRRGDEHIWFWGAPDQVSTARAELRRHRGAAIPDLALGTVTVLSAEHEFGPGHGELCRSGSVDRNVGAVAAILHRMVGYHSGADREVHDRYHTLLLAARNRATVPPVRGGEAVQHIHCTHVQSRYWGIVPFYVMQGGVLECTELRESNRDPSELGAALSTSGTWWFADPDDAAFAEALTRLNVAAGIDTQVCVSRTQPSDTKSLLIAPPRAELMPTNHTTVRAARVDESDAPVRPFPEAIRAAESLGSCTVAAQLPLDDPARTADQAWLARRGYTLTAISPPKRSWQVVADVRHETVSSPTGVWCRVRRGLSVVPPYYLDRADLDPDETTLLEQLRSRLAAIHTHP
ncbi:hypothetical protein [Nocardia sp. XZ_19_369]|uniref:hypothetical protein n=1 Tax=Nocardia sp. XZ_19_369 TaxID=2769487 RepID=UPI00188FC25C|nr:hypothetical protein [Nocardia sp. XZ_19_369]